jgi:hypothetical protein
MREQLTSNKHVNFLINVVPLNIKWEENYRIYEIDMEDWDNKKDYNIIKSLKSILQFKDILIETHGRLLVIIPLKTNIVLDEVLNSIKNILQQEVDKKNSINIIENPLTRCENNSDILNAIRKGIGEIVKGPF